MRNTKLKNHQDVLITGKLYLGSNSQPFDLIMDTGSGNSWVMHRLCTDCTKSQPKFDERTSDTFGFYPAMYDYHYGAGDVYCYDSFDRFCLNEGEGCTSNKFSFFTIASMKNLDDLMAPGLVGLSPGWDPQGRGDRLILRLYEAGAIEAKLFSFYINFDSQSILTMGGINAEKFVKKGHEIKYVDANPDEDTWWTLALDKFSFGDTEYTL